MKAQSRWRASSRKARWTINAPDALMSEFHRIRTILRDYGDLFGDVGDLLRKQLRLAERRTEARACQSHASSRAFCRDWYNRALCSAAVTHRLCASNRELRPGIALVLHTCSARSADYRRHYLLHGAREGDRRKSHSEASFRSARRNRTNSQANDCLRDQWQSRNGCPKTGGYSPRVRHGAAAYWSCRHRSLLSGRAICANLVDPFRCQVKPALFYPATRTPPSPGRYRSELQPWGEQASRTGSWPISQVGQTRHLISWPESTSHQLPRTLGRVDLQRL